MIVTFRWIGNLQCSDCDRNRTSLLVCKPGCHRCHSLVDTQKFFARSASQATTACTTPSLFTHTRKLHAPPLSTPVRTGASSARTVHLADSACLRSENSVQTPHPGSCNVCWCVHTHAHARLQRLSDKCARLVAHHLVVLPLSPSSLLRPPTAKWWLRPLQPPSAM
jgi:hypothetical protein